MENIESDYESSDEHIKSSLPSDSICKRPIIHSPSMNIENTNINNCHEIRPIEDDQEIPEVYESNPKQNDFIKNDIQKSSKVVQLESQESDEEPVSIRNTINSKPVLFVRPHHLKTSRSGSRKNQRKSQGSSSTSRNFNPYSIPATSRALETSRDSSERDLHKRKRSFTNKNSDIMSQNLIKKQIQTTVEYLSQNGYISFPNFLQALYLLQITTCLGRVNLPNHESASRAKAYREQVERREFEFATNLWNIINKFLFNYVDSVICIDFLTILLSKNPLDNVDLVEEYLSEVSIVDNIPEEEILKNIETNRDIFVEHPWSIQHLFYEYLTNLKQPVQITRQIKGPLAQVKLIETLNEHYKEYTFKPKISKKSKQIEKQKKEEAIHHINSFIEEQEALKNETPQIESSEMFQRKKSVNISRRKKSLKGSKIDDWLNRSHDHSTHNRLYNEAKILDAKLMHQRKIHWHSGEDGCTFQPRLVTNPEKTRKLCAARTKSLESQLSTTKLKQRTRNIKSQNAVNSVQNNRIMTKASISKKKPRQKGMKNYLKILREKEMIKNQSMNMSKAQADVNEDNHEGPQSSSKGEDKKREPLGMMKNSGSRNNMPAQPKKTILIPYKHSYKDKDTKGDIIELKIHYTKTKCATLHVTKDSNPRDVAKGFCKTYGLGKSMYDSLVAVITKKKEKWKL
ncbi:unnamed protein product [Moneuplotes crassus]|uniref:Uncharacterized protein n=1 Tax=Euplotes crassus TaxID=5936 RepID=A0AAD1Y6C8_EUPCR|nr:unnamed protein product [Moneuplotes crassus]